MEQLNFSMERTRESELTLILLVFWWLNEAFELHIYMDFDAKEKSYLQEHQLQLANTWKKQTILDSVYQQSPHVDQTF